jgi:hypothetical protein
MEDMALEKFYVYRSISRSESWGAVIFGGESKLPNIDFGMKVFAVNEKEAIAKAKEAYDKIHAYDSDKENVRRFAAAALKAIVQNDTSINEEIAATKAMVYATALNVEYTKYFSALDDSPEE